MKGLEFHGGLVCFDLREDFSFLHLVSDLLEPFCYGSFGHGVTQPRHGDHFNALRQIHATGFGTRSVGSFFFLHSRGCLRSLTRRISGLAEQCLEILTFFTDNGQQAVDICSFAFLNSYVKKGSLMEGFKFHGGLVGLDLGQNLSFFYVVAYFLEPFCDHSFRHGVAQSRHGYYFRHFQFF